jgi:hypothetical protein
MIFVYMMLCMIGFSHYVAFFFVGKWGALDLNLNEGEHCIAPHCFTAANGLE